MWLCRACSRLPGNESVRRPADANAGLASAVVPAAITHPSFELCSAPCKARRFAPPTRVSARGLRTLTAPARSSPDCNCVMATPWPRVEARRRQCQEIARGCVLQDRRARRPRRLSRPGVNTLVHRHRPRFEHGRERRTSLPIPSPWSRTSDRRTASGPALHAGLRRHPFPSPVNRR